MEESNIWIIGVVALAIGGLIGFLMGRAGDNSNEKEKLEDAKKELEEYKNKVSGHFEETADLVNKMTESYRGVYQHLATGAQALCDADTARSIESSMTPQLAAQKEVDVTDADTNTAQDAESVTEAQTLETVEPPRDYAPKQPDEEGTLSESYGLKESDDSIQTETETPAENNTPKA